MNYKILIATYNNSKFEIVKNILISCGMNNSTFNNLNELNLKNKIKEEIGNLEERAKQKADFIFNELNQENYFDCIIGIDDAIEIRGKIEIEVKKLIPNILNNKLLISGEEVNICRAFYFKNTVKTTSCITKIPFVYKKYDNDIKNLKNEFYPLSHVLCPINNKIIPIVELTENKENIYNLKFCKEILSKKIIEFFNF